MSLLATILYEDSKRGPEYPLHRLVLRMLEDDINGETRMFLKNIQDNPKRGIDNILKDIPKTSLLAGPGKLLVLVDRDKIVEHINKNKRTFNANLPPKASPQEIEQALCQGSDAPEKLCVFFLTPNMEGLIRTISKCAPGQWTSEIERATHKDLSARDDILATIAQVAYKNIRACVRAHQPDLDRLVKELAKLLPSPPQPLPAQDQ